MDASLFRSLIVNREGDNIIASVKQIGIDDLPAGNCLIDVEYSSINYKDALVLAGKGNLVKDYPHVPGIDLAGKIVSAPGFAVGNEVIVTGWRIGEIRWGGYATKARVNTSEVVRAPAGLSAHDAMAFGTAGFTAMLAVMDLEDQGLLPSDSPVLVTGATGGVGSFAISLLSLLGFKVTALTRKMSEAAYLRALGADQVLDQNEFLSSSARPLSKEVWSGCIDSVGGETLARVLSQMKYGGSVAAIGLAGGSELSTTVIPFIIRGVRLIGVDSVMCPAERRTAVWSRIFDIASRALPRIRTRIIPLEHVAEEACKLLNGSATGRTVVDPNN